MKKWNYRVVLDAGGVYRISEVYYSDEGLPTGWAESSLLGDTPEDLAEDARLMMGAFSRPILKVTSSDASLEEIGPMREEHRQAAVLKEAADTALTLLVSDDGIDYELEDKNRKVRVRIIVDVIP